MPKRATSVFILNLIKEPIPGGFGHGARVYFRNIVACYWFAQSAGPDLPITGLWQAAWAPRQRRVPWHLIPTGPRS